MRESADMRHAPPRARERAGSAKIARATLGRGASTQTPGRDRPRLPESISELEGENRHRGPGWNNSRGAPQDGVSACDKLAGEPMSDPRDPMSDAQLRGPRNLRRRR